MRLFQFISASLLKGHKRRVANISYSPLLCHHSKVSFGKYGCPYPVPECGYGCLCLYVFSFDYERWMEYAIDQGKFAVMASIDFSSAFDQVNENLLMQRLRIIGLPKDIHPTK